ncbi:Ankyrin repeat domain-containing protein SOWAHC [Bagarius yarrelli]|uniref:Ankyrin repeat domain-containing protein SOWAHC n=1 Tax=Bagarius yarrelli TaxID=175774 RepID=A0A556V0H7_BAGYA|nr:Ankyrin repeat domain-containing protein SOWAHC [Bagarius yarrelli]
MDDIKSKTSANSQMAESAALPIEQKHKPNTQMNKPNESDPAFTTEPTPAAVRARGVSLPLSAVLRRSKFHRQGEASESKPPAEVQEKGSVTPAMRKKYLQDLFRNCNSHGGLSTILSFKSASVSLRDSVDATAQGADESKACWVLDPTEHAWMLAVVDGSYDTISEFLKEEPSLLSRKDLVSGYTALHWLAKQGKHEVLLKLIKDSERRGYPVSVNLKGSGGVTPLHVAVMHNQYMVIKILVGALNANVEAMDYNGKRAWQYLKEDAPGEMKELLGAWDEEHTNWQLNTNNNNTCCSEAASTETCQKVTNTVDAAPRNGLWRLGSFRKILSTFFSGGKN